MKKVSNTSGRLKEYMKLTGLKQVDILERCKPFETEKYKITNPHLSQYISGKFEPNQRRLEILAQAMDVDEVWLMGYDVPMRDNEINESEDSVDALRDRVFAKSPTLFKTLDKASSEQIKIIEKVVNDIVDETDN